MDGEFSSIFSYLNSTNYYYFFFIIFVWVTFERYFFWELDFYLFLFME